MRDNWERGRRRGEGAAPVEGGAEGKRSRGLCGDS